jgi:hypothetical protein
MTKSKPFKQPLFSKSEQRDLEEAPPELSALLEEEINMVRFAIRRLFKISKSQSADEAVKTLAVLSAVSGRLAGLIRAQQQLMIQAPNSGNSELRTMLESVLAEVRAEWPKL